MDLVVNVFAVGTLPLFLDLGLGLEVVRPCDDVLLFLEVFDVGRDFWFGEFFLKGLDFLLEQIVLLIHLAKHFKDLLHLFRPVLTVWVLGTVPVLFWLQVPFVSELFDVPLQSGDEGVLVFDFLVLLLNRTDKVP